MMTNVKEIPTDFLIERQNEIYKEIEILKDEMIKNLNQLESLDREVNFIYLELNDRESTKQ